MWTCESFNCDREEFRQSVKQRMKDKREGFVENEGIHWGFYEDEGWWWMFPMRKGFDKGFVKKVDHDLVVMSWTDDDEKGLRVIIWGKGFHEGESW